MLISIFPLKKTPIWLVKLGGGYGIYKEAAMMTLEDLINKPQSAWEKSDRIYKKHRQFLENHAFKIGQQATNILQLKDIHPEIQKMVGALNWRTSYRQNQYFHSLRSCSTSRITSK